MKLSYVVSILAIGLLFAVAGILLVLSALSFPSDASYGGLSMAGMVGFLAVTARKRVHAREAVRKEAAEKTARKRAAQDAVSSVVA